MERHHSSRSLFVAFAGAGLLSAAAANSAHAQLTLPINQSAALNGSVLFRINNTSSTDNSGAINGNTSAATGIVYGIRGSTGSVSGRGVIGFAVATTGENYGVYGESRSASGRGVFGFGNSLTGVNSGVYGESFSPTGRGVVGVANSGTGVRAESSGGLALDVVGTSQFSGNAVFQSTSVHAGTATFNGAGTAIDVNGPATFDGTATFGGIATFNGDLSLAANRSIFGNGVMGVGGTALDLRLGDSADDLVTVSGELDLSGRVTLLGPAAGIPTLSIGNAEEDQLIGFYDTGSADENYILWDDALAITSCGTLGPIQSAFVWHIEDNSNSAWLFSNFDTNLGIIDYEFKVGSVGDVEMDGFFTQQGACDLAEAFLGPADLEAGTVVVLDPNVPEAVRMSNMAYETGIAGVVSTQPGILMRGPTADAYPIIQELGALLRLRESEPMENAEVDTRIDELESELDSWTRGDVSVALVGRVPVKADATFGAIRPGDALTSSPTPGFAMKATQAGTILGTAISGLEDGQGEVIVFLHVGYWAPAGDGAPQAELAALREENAEMRVRLERLEALIERLGAADGE